VAGLVPAIGRGTTGLDRPGHDGDGWVQGGSAAAGRWGLAMTGNPPSPDGPGQAIGAVGLRISPVGGGQMCQGVATLCAEAFPGVWDKHVLSPRLTWINAAVGFDP
jgi:hypothetical protein